MNDKIKLAMFDLDGTLFDTEKANYLAYKQACGEEYPVDEVFFGRYCMSLSYKDFLPKLGVPPELMKKVHDDKIACYGDYFYAIRKNETLFALAGLLKENGTKLCIVTTASRKNVFAILDYFKCRDMFDMFVTQESVEKQKPAPDCYIYAMEQCGAKPGESIIFEDSETGIRAAMGSGAAVYCVEKF